MNELSWVVTSDAAGKRLDVFLSETIDGLTRSQAKKRIDAGEFCVNDKPASAHKELKVGDIVKVVVLEHMPHIDEDDTEDRTVRISASDLHIIDETDDWIVLNKQTGVLMHPRENHPHDNNSGTLIDAIIERCPEVAKVGEDPHRPGIMSRLDKDVSGLVVIAKKQDALDDLKKQFATHSVKKDYLALVYGEMPKAEGDIKFRVARSTDKARMAALPETSDAGRMAWTHYEVQKRFHGATLLRLQILTGRTHQIRVHLFGLGHPVVGDMLYKPKKQEVKITAPRLMLQSVALEFNDPATGKSKSFRIDPDPEFDRLSAQLK